MCISYPCKLAKTWRKGKAPPKPLKFYSFPGKKKLRVCANLDMCLSKHESWDTKEFQVLVNFVKPHKAVTSSTVSRWLKEGWPIAGIDASMFMGHSTRADSTTKA